MDEQSRHVILSLVAKLREKGISCDFDMKKRSLKKQLEYADSMKIPIVIILGPRELEKSVVKVRTMGTRAETEVKISEMTDEVIRKLQ